MHVAVDRKEFVSSMETSSRVRAKQSSMRVLRHVFIKVENGSFLVAGTDLTRTGIAKIPRVILDATSPHQAIIDPEKVLSLMKKSKVERVEIHIEAESVSVMFGRTSIEIPTLPVEEYPVLPEGETTASFEIPSTVIRDAILEVLPCVSTDETRPYLNSLCIQIGGETAHVLGTDGHRLAIRDIEDLRHETPIEILIPLSGAKELVRNLKAKDLAEGLTMECMNAGETR